MEYISYGKECIISILLLLVMSHVILDLLPLIYRRLSRAFVSVPNDFNSRVTLITLILTACFLLS